MSEPPLARLGGWAHHHRATVIVLWAIFAIGLGAFAPKLEHALSGAMWEVNGSDSSPLARLSTSSSAECPPSPPQSSSIATR